MGYKTPIPLYPNYVVSASDNYDTDIATALQSETGLNVATTDTAGFAWAYDPIRRCFNYLCGYFSYNSSPQNVTNDTGFTVFDVGDSYANGADFNAPPTEPVFVMSKNQDTGVVTRYDTRATPQAVIPPGVGAISLSLYQPGGSYEGARVEVDPASGYSVGCLLDAGGGGSVVHAQITQWGGSIDTMPTFTIVGDGSGASIATTLVDPRTPSDGTWIRQTRDLVTLDPSQYNTPGLTDPRSGDFWVAAPKGGLYNFRLQDNFALTLEAAYMSIPTWADNAYTNPVRLSPMAMDDNWVYGLTWYQSVRDVQQNRLVLVPRQQTPLEISADSKLPYVIWYDNVCNDDYASLITFGSDGAAYVFGWYYQGVSPNCLLQFRLCQISPPPVSLGGLGTNLSGGYIDVTPWAALSTGPNADGLAGAPLDNDTVFAGADGGFIRWMRLPLTNQGVALEIIPTVVTATNSDTYNTNLISCTYVQFGDMAYEHYTGILGPMLTSTYTSTLVAADAAYVVLGIRETNSYLARHNFVFPGTDYTTYWFQVVLATAPGGVATDVQKIVFMQYKFVYGQAPQLVQILPEDSYDNANSAFGTAIDNALVIAAVTPKAVPPPVEGYIWPLDFNAYPGVYDPLTDTFWFNGVHVQSSGPNTAQPAGYDNAILVNSALAYRTEYNTFDPAINYSGVTPPFVQFTASPPTNLSVSAGRTYTTSVRLTRPIANQEAWTQGPALGKTRRTHQFSALLVQTQGISFGIDEEPQRPANFTTRGGTPIPPTTLFNGVYWNTLEADYNYTNMLAWSITRPYPATVAMMEGHIETQDR